MDNQLKGTLTYTSVCRICGWDVQTRSNHILHNRRFRQCHQRAESYELSASRWKRIAITLALADALLVLGAVTYLICNIL